MVAAVKNISFGMSNLSNFLLDGLLAKWEKDRSELELKWEENENAFNGVSAEMFPSMNNQVTLPNKTWKDREWEDWRSKTFVMLTKRKVLTAYAMVVDIALEGAQLPFNLDHSPWGEVTLEEMKEEEREFLDDALSDMIKLIHQQILDCKGDRETINCIMSCAKYGETYWRSYVRDVTRKGFNRVNMAPAGGVRSRGDEWEYFEKTIKSPAFRHVSVWDMFRDLEQNDMQVSQGYTEMSYVSAFDLRRYQELQEEAEKQGYSAGYITDAIDRVIDKHGSMSLFSSKKRKERPGLRNINERYSNITQHDFFCRVPRDTLEKFEKSLEGKEEEFSGEPDVSMGDEVEVFASMAEDEVIRLVRTKEKTRPHGRVCWEDDPDSNHGKGVADNVKPTQATTNGVMRAVEDNLKLSANVMTFGKANATIGWDGKWRPGTHVESADEVKDVREAFQQIILHDVSQSLLPLMGLLERFADEDSHLPKILQGAVLDKQKPDTLGELSILQSNAGKYIGSVFKNFDDFMFEPITWRFYEYNMIDESVTRGKGNYIAQPLGYAMFRDRVIRVTKLMQAIQIVMADPEARRDIRLKDIYSDVFKSLDIDPDRVWKTKEEKEADAQAMIQAQQQAIDTQVAVMLARFKAESEKSVKDIQEKHRAELEQMEAEHRNKLEEIEAESQNRIVEGKIGGE